MSSLLTKSDYISFLTARYPALAQQSLNQLISENLVSPFEIELPQAVWRQAQNIAAAVFEVRDRQRKALALQMQTQGLHDPGNHSILMSLDFHLQGENQLKLIEINTNASFLALGCAIYESRGLPPPGDFRIDQLRACIENELRESGRTAGTPHIAIVDADPPSQRLYIEFLLYREIFRSWGWSATIADTQELNWDATNGNLLVRATDSPAQKVDFVYNRTTDFFLAEPQSRALRQAYVGGGATVSPHPLEYFLSADKQRLVEWSQPGYLQTLGVSPEHEAVLQSALLRSVTLSDENADELWEQRKNFFFKPKTAFGGKYTYRGSSLRSKAFAEIRDRDFLAQEFCPAPEREFASDEGSKRMKFDLRFYFYRDQVQTGLARLYQGQVTNLQTPLGGLAPLRLT
jgi:hypothetical protein